MSAAGTYPPSQYPHGSFASAPLACLARKQGIVRLVQRTVILVTAAVATLAPVASTTAAAASTSPAQGTAQSGAAGIGVTAIIPVGGNPLAVAVNPVTNTTYVTNTVNGSSVSVINGQTDTAVATVQLPVSATGVAVNPRTNTIYAANDSASAVSVIRGRTDTVVATVDVGFLPQGVAANPVTRTVYVANSGDGTVSVLAP